MSLVDTSPTGSPPELAPTQPASPVPYHQTTTAKVLHVVNGEHYSGAERVQDLLGLNLPALGYEPGFACLVPHRFPEERRCKSTSIYLTAMQSKLDFGVTRQLSDIVRREGYRLLHAHTVRGVSVAKVVSTMTGIPLVYHVHSPASNDSTRKFANVVNAWTERIGLTGVAQMIAVSHSLAQHMQKKGYDANRVTVVPNGVPCRPELIDREPPTEKWVLGTVALFRPRKGTEVLLEALALLRDELRCDVRIRAVGPFETGVYHEKITRMAERLGVQNAIDWVGYTDNVDAELDQMDMLVLPSLFGEGLPMVVLEAMAAGVPVVGTRVEGVPEVLHDGKYGMIATPGCSRDLADTIKRVILGETSWSRLRVEAWQRQSNEYSDNSMAAGVASVYDRVLDS